MVRYSFLVGLLPPRLHAGLSRRLRSVTVAAQNEALRYQKLLPSHARQQVVISPGLGIFGLAGRWGMDQLYRSFTILLLGHIVS